MITTLDELLHPLTTADFLNKFRSKAFGHVNGPAGKFHELFPWEQLNAILEQHRLSTPRLRLLRQGQVIPEASYFHSAAWPEPSAGKVLHELENGATLGVSFVEETYPPLRELAVSLEGIFRVRLHVNLYASWTRENGFDVHYDDHDVLALQIYGSKHWSIWPATHSNPLASAVVTDADSIGQPVWDGSLTDGSLLYVPRGCWHVAHALDQPSLHLTIAIKNRTGVDLLNWMANRLRDSSLARRDLPYLDTVEARTAYLAQLREEMCCSLDDDVIERYLQWLEGNEPARPAFTLPCIDASPGQPFVKLIGARRFSFRPSSNGASECHLQERRWTCPSAVAPVLLELNDGKWHSMGSLKENLSPRDGELLAAIVAAMVMGRELLSSDHCPANGQEA
jgi:ribosomal protein L16 Arg81 hydroxylase